MRVILFSSHGCTNHTQGKTGNKSTNLYIICMAIPLTTLDKKKNFPVFVAVVDDEPDLANLFRDALNQIPYVNAFGFSDPNLALEHFRLNHRNYKCIISDYRMPSINGLELLGEVRAINSDVTRILISAFEIQDKLFEDCQCVDKFLQKPIKIVDMIEVVQNCLNRIRIKESDRE
jgi:DNA-binding NtrC family response regulator